MVSRAANRQIAALCGPSPRTIRPRAGETAAETEEATPYGYGPPAVVKPSRIAAGRGYAGRKPGQVRYVYAGGRFLSAVVASTSPAAWGCGPTGGKRFSTSP